MAKRTARSTSRSRRSRRPRLADRADPFSLYQEAVQSPAVDVALFSRVYGELLGGHSQRLREDFCGAAAVCCAWVESAEGREAWGVDLDASALAWGRVHNIERLREGLRSRVHLVEGDVRKASLPGVDIVCAQNFSYCVFQTRSELRSYFRGCLEGLEGRGLLIVDLFGGYESIEDEREEVTIYDGFRYVWEQHRYDPINARGIYKIHFRFPDGSALDDAFVYDWRLWTIPEVREVLLEAGFGRSVVYWEDEDPETGEGTGTYSPRTSGACDPAWNAYIIGVKGDMEG